MDPVRGRKVRLTLPQGFSNSLPFLMPLREREETGSER
jgi:hypothetical protein